MKVLFVAVNAKYIHTNLAVRYLKKFNEDIAECKILEFTVNGFPSDALAEIFAQKPDAVFFSCYLWNIDFIRQICADLRKILPLVKIVLGGPEVSFCGADFFAENPFADFVIAGEGEIPSRRLIKHFKGEIPVEDVPSVSFLDEKGEFVLNPKCPPMNMDEVPFPYDDLEAEEHKIIYYETQRGCPFSCKYCLSSLEGGVRFLSRKKVKEGLDFFLEKAPPLVKFVDRTFNCNPEHSRFIWEYLIDHDNGKTCFHMEIKGELLSLGDFELLSKARKGLFRFEIGVQTGNEAVLSQISRNAKKPLLYENARRIIALGNIHTHLDLIAGLPGEDFSSFRSSFNEVYSLKPDELQLGFLKLLKGSDLRENSEDLGITYSDKAPYEVLSTRELSYGELLRLKDFENVLEIFYNSDKAVKTFGFCGRFFESPFEMYDRLGTFWKEQGFGNLTKDDTYKAALTFFAHAPETAEMAETIREMLFLDYLLQSRSYKTPLWARKAESEETRNKRTEILRNKPALEELFPEIKGISPKDVQKFCRIEPFRYDVLSESPKRLENERWVVVFYGKNGAEARYFSL